MPRAVSDPARTGRDPSRVSRARLAAFAVTASVLVTVALLLAKSHSDPRGRRLADPHPKAPSTTTPPTPTGRTTESERRRSLHRASRLAALGEDLPLNALPNPALLAERAALNHDARRFLRAYLSYEVGAMTAHTQRTLARTATVSFAEELLASPPRPTATTRLPPRARVLALEPTFTGGGPTPTAQVNAAIARHASGREAISLLFQRRGGRWLAVSIGP